MAAFEPQNPEFEPRVRETFAKQSFLGLLGVELTEVEPGYVELVLSHRPDLTQQHGFFHGGAIATLADVAGGFAALTLMPAEAQVLSVEFKINLLAPGKGARLLVRGETIRAGRTLTICQSDVYAETEDGSERLIASALGTFMAREG